MADESRIENILDATLGDASAEIPSPPFSRIEEKLIELKEAIESGGGGEGGTTNYNALTNKPSINGHTLQGNSTLDSIGAASKVTLDAAVEELELMETELDSKVDKEAGKGLSTNDFTDTDKSNLATALEKANAAAPQATTYTKTEVDTALSAKQNTLTTAQQAAVDSGIDSTKAAQISENADDIATITPALVKQVDEGAKNLLKISATSRTINGVTFTVNDDGTIAVNGTATANTFFVINPSTPASVLAGTFNLSGCPYGYNQASARECRLFMEGKAFDQSDIGSGIMYTLTETTDMLITFEVYNGATINNAVIKPMLCTASDWAISQKFVPYALPNTTIIPALVKQVDEGAKNIFKMRDPVTISTHGITFVINTDGTIDLSTDDNGATEQTDLTIGKVTTKINTNYVLSGCPLGGSSTTYRLMISNSVYDEGNGYAYTSLVDGTRSPFIRVYQGAVITSPVKFYPMLCTASDYAISPEFVPYAPSNRELYEMIQALQAAQNGG